MAIRSSVLSVLLLTGDPDLQVQLKQDFKDATVIVAKDWASVSRAAGRRPFDLVILETKRNLSHYVAEVQRAVDLSRTVVLAGPRSVLRHLSGAVHAIAHRNGHLGAHTGPSGPNLEDYIETKFSEFVKGMKSSSARNLHPMLIKAIEKPLITLALKETNGNQIQAAHLLGMNRNTLRKKITELRIPVTRGQVRRPERAQPGHAVGVGEAPAP